MRHASTPDMHIFRFTCFRASKKPNTSQLALTPARGGLGRCRNRGASTQAQTCCKHQGVPRRPQRRASRRLSRNQAVRNLATAPNGTSENHSWTRVLYQLRHRSHRCVLHANITTPTRVDPTSAQVHKTFAGQRRGDIFLGRVGCRRGARFRVLIAAAAAGPMRHHGSPWMSRGSKIPVFGPGEQDRQ